MPGLMRKLNSSCETELVMRKLNSSCEIEFEKYRVIQEINHRE